MACGLSGTVVGLSAASLWLGTPPLLPSCQLVSLQHHFLLHLNIHPVEHTVLHQNPKSTTEPSQLSVASLQP